METSQLLTVDEVAAMLRRTPGQIRWMRKTGRGPKGAVIAGRIFFRQSDVVTWIDQQFTQEAS